MIGKNVKWKALNGTVDGVIVEPFPSKKGGDWLVQLKNKKYCIVNEKSFING